MSSIIILYLESVIAEYFQQMMKGKIECTLISETWKLGTRGNVSESGVLAVKARGPEVVP